MCTCKLIHTVTPRNTWAFHRDTHKYVLTHTSNRYTHVPCSCLNGPNSHWLWWPGVSHDLFPASFWSKRQICPDLPSPRNFSIFLPQECPGTIFFRLSLGSIWGARQGVSKSVLLRNELWPRASRLIYLSPGFLQGNGDVQAAWWACKSHPQGVLPYWTSVGVSSVPSGSISRWFFERMIHMCG